MFDQFLLIYFLSQVIVCSLILLVAMRVPHWILSKLRKLKFTNYLDTDMQTWIRLKNTRTNQRLTIPCDIKLPNDNDYDNFDEAMEEIREWVFSRHPEFNAFRVVSKKNHLDMSNLDDIIGFQEKLDAGRSH